VALEDEDPPAIGTDVGVGVTGLDTSLYSSGSRAFAGPYSSVCLGTGVEVIPRLNLHPGLCQVVSCAYPHSPT